MNKANITFTLALIILFLVISIHIVAVNLSPESSANSTHGNPRIDNVGFGPSDAMISVDPPISEASVGQTFVININVSDVVDLYGWEFKLGWDSTILEALSVVEGPFLRQGGNTFFWPKINNSAGYMLVDCTLLGDVAGVTGYGTLAIAEFHVETEGECILDLYDTKFINSQERPINHTAIDGYYCTIIHDVAVINLVASESSVNVTVENQGAHTETFDVSVYYTHLTDPLIGTRTITLETGANTILTFSWTPPTCGRYEILAEASIVLGEVDTADNIRTTIIDVGSSSEGASVRAFFLSSDSLPHQVNF